MPIAIALLVRSLIQLAVTAAIYQTAESFIRTALNALPKILQKTFGIDEQTSLDFIHDFMLDQAIAFGLTALSLRKKMPTVVAEKLGFTTKGFNKLGFSATAKAQIEKTMGSKIPTDLTKGVGYWSLLGKFMGAITAIFMLTQSIEVFAYRPQFFVNIARFFGLDKPVRALIQPARAPLFSDTEIQDFTNGLIQTYGAGFEDEFLQASVLITPDFTKMLIEAGEDNVRAQLKTPTQANVLKAIREEILPARATARPSISTPSPIRTTAPTVKLPARAKTVFKPAADELTNLALDKVAEFIDAIPPRLDFEIASKTNPTDEDGNVSSGKHIILRVYLKSGSSVKNKFADIILRPYQGDEKALTSAEEDPIEEALRFAIANTPVMDTQSIATLSAPAEKPETLAVITPINFPAEVADSLLRFAIWNDDFITDFKADVHLPADLAQPPGNGRSPQLKAGVLEQLRADIKRYTGEQDPSIISFIGDTITEYRRDDLFRSMLGHAEWAKPFVGEGKIIKDENQFAELGLYLLNRRRKPRANTPVGGRSGFVRFKGSPDVFNRFTGTFINYTIANQLKLFEPGKVEELPYQRPEVLSAADFATWSGKDLTRFPI